MSSVRRTMPFTLIELLVVMAIIVGLAGLLMATTYGVMRKMKQSKAQAQIEAMELAMEQYKNDRGYYPQSGGSEMGLTDAFIKSLTNSSTGRPLINADEVGFGIDESNMLVDPWGNPWLYEVPGEMNQQKFDLWSAGPNGIDDRLDPDSGDDIANWKRN